MTQDNSVYAKVQNSLERLQGFDVKILPRKTELGLDLCFDEVVPYATRVISMYKRLSLTALADFTEQQLGTIASTPDADYNRLMEVADFKIEGGDPSPRRLQLIDNIRNSYSNSFQALMPFISYSNFKEIDHQGIEDKARATVQRIEDMSAKGSEELNLIKEAAEKVLDDVREVAEEQGVSQQAEYFKKEAEYHTGEAAWWRSAVFIAAGVLASYAVFSLFFHKIPWFSPQGKYEIAQFIVSKVLIFGVLSFSLYLSVRNYMSHQHNAIVNKHRQNSLMTYQAFMNAADGSTGSEAVLLSAASCIYSPQPTGYASENGNGQSFGGRNVIELLSKPIVGND